MKMAESLAIPEDSLKDGTAHRIADLISQAQPVLLVCLGYYAGAWIAKALRFPDSNLSLIWPPTAILLGAFRLPPPRKWGSLYSHSLQSMSWCSFKTECRLGG